MLLTQRLWRTLRFHIEGGWKLSAKIRNRVGTLGESVCGNGTGGVERESGYTAAVVARCAKVAQHWALRAIKKREKRSEKKKFIVVEYYYYYYYQTQERNAHYTPLLLQQNTATVYNIVHARLQRERARRAAAACVHTVILYILLLFHIISSGGYNIESLFPFRVRSSGRAGRSHRFTKPPAGSACASDRRRPPYFNGSQLDFS